VRVLLDKRPGKATQKRWTWVKKGVPLILEIGGRDAANGQVSVLRRDRLWREDGKPDFLAMARDEFLGAASAELEAIQRALFEEARARRDANIHRGIAGLDELATFYAEEQRYPGWVELAWSRPSGAELDDVVTRLKALKLTIRNTPMGGAPVSGTCLFTGKPAIERIYVARAY
jgi:prolyl-tRNA synthetase